MRLGFSKSKYYQFHAVTIVWAFLMLKWRNKERKKKFQRKLPPRQRARHRFIAICYWPCMASSQFRVLNGVLDWILDRIEFLMFALIALAAHWIRCALWGLYNRTESWADESEEEDDKWMCIWVKRERMMRFSSASRMQSNFFFEWASIILVSCTLDFFRIRKTNSIWNRCDKKKTNRWLWPIRLC